MVQLSSVQLVTLLTSASAAAPILDPGLFNDLFYGLSGQSKIGAGPNATHNITARSIPNNLPQQTEQSSSSCNSDQLTTLIQGVNDAAVIAKSGIEAFDAVQASLQSPPGYAWDAILNLDKTRLTNLYNAIFGAVQDRDSFQKHRESVQNIKDRLSRIADLMPKAGKGDRGAYEKLPMSVRLYCDDSHYQQKQSDEPKPAWLAEKEHGCTSFYETDLAATLWLDADHVPSCGEDGKTKAFTKTINKNDLITFCPKWPGIADENKMEARNISNLDIANNTKLDLFDNEPFKLVLHELLHTTTFNDPDETGALGDQAVRDYVAPGSKQHILKLTAYNFDQVKTLAKQSPELAAINIPSIVSWCIASHFKYADWSSGEARSRF